MDHSVIAPAVVALRQLLVRMKSAAIWSEIVLTRDGVFARFQPIFEAQHLSKLSESELRPFFYYEHNHHWTGLYRQVNRVCSDMERTRRYLSKLLDESRPIEARFEEVGDGIPGMGKAIMTAILTVAFPDKYGVWNSTAEAGMLKAGVWPEFERGTSFGQKYRRINELLKALATELDIDFWTLDTLWWYSCQGDILPGSSTQEAVVEPTPTTPAGVARFGLERHLHDFLYDNWNSTNIGHEWKIYSQPGSPDAGYEYACGVGRIDILAQHKTAGKWLVVELKRDETSDSVVGQVLRYMGWVQKHLASPGEVVCGMVIASSADSALEYAVSMVPGLTFMSYEVEFRLVASPKL